MFTPGISTLPLIDKKSKEVKDGLEIKVLPTTSIWKGVTYKEDVEELKAHIRECIENGEYPENLWG